ncbi:MAG TPA: hypothetical protein VNE21_01990 [Mycobacteriales bacterium]|nr:hypothetical protein [Mycobacteriales bacterium]
MSWNWRYETAAADPASVAGGAASEAFPTQSDAESWLGEAWRELLAAGVDQVSLFEDDRLVYGGMSLHPPGP